MTRHAFDFLEGESGGASVDWVVLASAVVGIGIAVIALVSGGYENLSHDISSALANTRPLTEPFAANVDITSSSDTVLQ